MTAAFLGLYPPQGEPPHPALLYPRNARMRAGVEFIQAHAGDPLTVGQIAEAAGLSIRSTHGAALGFFHLGRFSGAYRERFGEYPKATLRR